MFAVRGEIEVPEENIPIFEEESGLFNSITAFKHSFKPGKIGIEKRRLIKGTDFFRYEREHRSKDPVGG